MWNRSLRVSADPWALKGHRGLVKRPQNMKSITFACTRATLMQPNLSHMDFLGGRVAIHSSRTTSSKPTKSASPNELINQEISKKNRRFSPFSFLGFGPAVFPGWVISSHACIVFLSETISSSRVWSFVARFLPGRIMTLWPGLLLWSELSSTSLFIFELLDSNSNLFR